MQENSNQSVKRFVIFVTIVGGFAGLLFGVDFGVINGSLDFMMQTWHLSIAQGEIITSSLLLGALCGAIISGYVAKQFGRKNTMLFSAMIFTLASIIAACSVGYHMMVIMRFILGFGVGMASFCSPLYLAEIAPYQARGMVVAVYQLMITIGILVVFLDNAILSYFNAWRLMIGFVAIPGLVMWIGVTFLPKTPRWLLLKNRQHEALEVLKKIRSKSSEIQQELTDIKQILAKKSDKLSSLLTSKPFISILLLGMFLQLYQQFDGLNSFMYYSGHIYSAIGFSSQSQVWLTVLIGLINLVSTILSMLFIDKIGRKALLYIGVSFMITCMIGMALMFYTHKAINFTPIGRTSFVITSLIFIFARAASTGPIAWIMCAEIFPLKSREIGITITTAMNWLCNTIIGRFSLSAFSTFGFIGTFFGFASVLIIGLFVIIWLVPETNGISLETLETNLLNGVKLRKIGG